MTDEIDSAKLSALVERTRQLPREIDPPADAWMAIKSELEKAPTGIHFGRAPGGSIWHKPAFLAAAAVFLVAASSLVTAAVLGRYGGSAHETASVQFPKKTQSRAVRVSPAGPRTMAEFAAVETGYISTANQLSSILETGTTTLSPETVMKLRKSLAIIDQAIVEARRALAADPANRALIDVLNTTYNQKLDLLRRTTEMGRS